MQRFRIFGIVMLFVSLGITFESSVSAPPTAGAFDCQTFQETGYKTCGRFLQYWNEHGGLTQQGFPISDVFLEQNAPPPAGDGKTHKVQYFQRARFEFHEENQPPYDVLLGLLGAEQKAVKYSTGIPADKGVQPPDGRCQTFQETGFSVCGKLLDYWINHGGLAQQGLPITGTFLEQNAPPPAGDGKVHTVQYFQRARFELHEENAAPYDILLGLLGGEQFGAKYTGIAITPVSPPADLGIPTPGPGPATGVKFTSIQGTSPGRTASVEILSAAYVNCSIVYIVPSGRVSTAAGLVNKTTDNHGVAFWSWLISGNTGRGTGSVTVTCDGQGSATTPITIG